MNDAASGNRETGAPQTMLTLALAEVLAAASAAPTSEAIAELARSMARAVTRVSDLAAEAETIDDSSGWLVLSDTERLSFSGPDLYVSLLRDRSCATVMAGEVVWDLAFGPTSVNVSATHGGEMVEQTVPLGWSGTHVVGTLPLEVGGVPAGTFAAGTVLDPGLPVRLIETTAEGWALVECANGWQCYVAASGLNAAA